MNEKKTIKENTISAFQVKSFRKEIYRYFKEFGRDLPWRKTLDPYRILVSEIMLQQTQVDRVINKYNEFIKVFPGFPSLKRAPLARIFSIWRGLGYNRRALALKKIARVVVQEYGGRLPDTVDRLSSLPGIGKATASAICAFAFNRPAVFIETNIRTVLIHRFFRRRRSVDDSEIAVFVEKTMDKNSPRKWYSALMDYGAMLKKEYPGLSKKSKQYKKQSSFQGSRRQLRGKVLGLLFENPKRTERMLLRELGGDKANGLHEILKEMVREGLITCEKGKYAIA
jgi:A/G-specific adenine glycosylase